MNTGAFGENFPYSNFHDLNTDWIIKIVKDFLDQYSHIQEIIAQGIINIGNKTDEGLTELQEKYDELDALLQEWYNTHSADIANQLASALNDLNTWYTTHQTYLDNILAQNEQAFQTYANQKTTESIASIPDDYTELYNSVVRVVRGLWWETIYTEDIGTHGSRTNNIFDNTVMYPGFLMDDGTLETAGTYANYLTSDFIRIKPSTAYSVSSVRKSDGGQSSGRKVILTYNRYMNTISASYVNQTGTTLTFTTGASACFVRICIPNDENGMFNEGPDKLPYVEYIREIDLPNTVILNAEMQAEIENQYGIFSSKSKNILDTENNRQGFLMEDGTIAHESSYNEYFTTKFLRIEPSTEYIFDCFRRSDMGSSGGRKCVLCYDQYFRPITASYMNTTGQSPHFTTPANAVYFRATAPTAEYAQIRLATSEIGYTAYSRTGELNNLFGLNSTMQTEVEELIEHGTSRFEDKKILNIGDSIATDQEGSRSYSYQFAQKTGAILAQDYAENGSTLSLTSDQGTRGCILTQAQTAVNSYPNANYDIIMIDGGTNDDNQNRTLGTIKSTNGIYTDGDYTAEFDTTTIIGALETIFKILRTQYPGAIIVFVIPHLNEHNRAIYNTMMDTIRETCEKWSIAILDMMKNGELNTRMQVMRNLYTDQGGTHPNTNGVAKFYVPKLIGLLSDYFTN